MCGIAGALGYQLTSQQQRDTATAMQEALYHRGPDRQSYYHDDVVQLLMVHTRLSIQDLSEAGNQPMASVCGRYLMVFNGEIYNHLELRKELGRQQTAWRGHSDTETLLALISHWGVPATLDRIVGMFAIALWDKQAHQLYLVRDRMGEKPLYYAQQGDGLIFASELKAMHAHPCLKTEIDSSQIMHYLQLGYIPAPHSIYQGVYKCRPGHYLIFNAQGKLLDDVCYWSLDTHITPSAHEHDDAMVDALERYLVRSINEQQISDVPLGAFLSGGVDSSTVVALMQHYGSVRTKTFSIGFKEQGFDEAQAAARIARYLETDHHELYVDVSDALNVIPKIPALYDEPFADSSQIPTWLVAGLAKQHVTVALSGDGGDELFAGYNRHVKALPLWQQWSHRPVWARSLLRGIVALMHPAQWDKLLALMPGIHVRQAGDKLNKLARVLPAKDFATLYQSLVTSDVPEGMSAGPRYGTPSMPPQSELTIMQYLDTTGYLTGDILTKVDRAAMSHSLETRIPMLDHRVVEFAFSLPDAVKVRAGQGKWLLRQVLHRHVPESFFEQAKSGFAIPLASWLRGSLRDWAESLLAPAMIRQQGLLSSDSVQRLWQQHLSGRYNHQTLLWHILMLQAWLAEQGR